MSTSQANVSVFNAIIITKSEKETEILHHCTNIGCELDWPNEIWEYGENEEWGMKTENKLIFTVGKLLKGTNNKGSKC